MVLSCQLAEWRLLYLICINHRTFLARTYFICFLPSPASSKPSLRKHPSLTGHYFMLFLSLSMFLGSPPWWRRLDLSGLNEPLQASKNPYSDFLKCFWQALKRLPSLTKMGSIKMSDERNVFLLLPWFQFSISAASMQSLSPTSRRSYQPITRFLIKWVYGHLGTWLRMQRLDSLLQKHSIGQTPHSPSGPVGMRHKGNFLLL